MIGRGRLDLGVGESGFFRFFLIFSIESLRYSSPMLLQMIM
jgi:hypothetical protein